MKVVKNKFGTYNIWGYILFYFAIILVITFVMGGYSYYFFYKTVYSDFLSGNELYLSAIVNRHENDMQIVDDIVTQVGLQDEVVRFKLADKPENARELMKYLKGYTTVSQFFDLLFYRFHEDKFLYHFRSSVNIDNIGSYWWILENTSVEEFLELSTEKSLKLRVLPEQGMYGEWITNYVKDDDYIILFRALPTTLQDTLIFMVPGSYYDELLAEETSDQRLDFLCYNGQIIVSRGGEQIAEQELLSLFEKVSVDEKEISTDILQERIIVANEEYLLSACKGESGISYVTLQSMEVYHDKLMTDQWIIVMLMLVCVLFAITIIIFASKGFVKKVRHLNELLNEDSYYDLSRIENGIQTLVNTCQESEKEGLILKKTRFIRNFIRGDFSSKKEAITEAQKARMSIDYKSYMVVLIRNRELSNENITYTSMLEAIDKAFGLEGYGIHLANSNQNLFVLYSDSQEAIEAVVQNMLEIEKEHGQEYVMAVSDYHTDFAEGAKAYLEAVTAFDNYLLMDNSKVIRFTEVSQKEYVNLLPESYLQRLKYAIRTGDNKAMETTVKDICSKLNKENVSLYAFRIFYNDVIHILLSEWQGDRTQFDNFYNVFILSQCLNIQEFGDLLCEICNVIIDGSSGKEMKVSDVVEEAIAYMQEHFYDSDLTMNALADYLEVSAVTLSVEFKNEMDMRPSDYLANLRMEKAKELLRTSDMLVREISQAVGYEDDRVFLRRFKKYTGMTPGQYRAE